MGAALAAVAAAPPEEITRSARLDVLGALAKEGLPRFDQLRSDYLALADSIGQGDIESNQVLADVKQAAIDPATFPESKTGRALAPHVIAFFMQDVCTTARVDVNGKQAVWVFSEFETDADFAHVAEWVNPHNWPARSPQMFKEMRPVTQVAAIPGFARSFHGEFLEVVQIGNRLRTQLHCDYYEQPGVFSGMTYELTQSLDGQIDVDRGFLLVNDLGASRHVKALKIVSFVGELWDEVALWVCPVWTDFVRGAAEGGTQTVPRLPSSTPGTIDDWIELMRRSAKRYAALGTSFVTDVASGTYGPDDLLRDGARFWLQAYRDFFDGATYAFAAMQELAGEQVSDATTVFPFSGPQAGPKPHSSSVTPFGVGAQPGTQSTTMPSPGTGAASGPLTVSDLLRVEAGGDKIPAAQVTASTVPLEGNLTGIRLEAVTTGMPQGLYVGEVTVGQDPPRPVQLYVSEAVAQ